MMRLSLLMRQIENLAKLKVCENCCHHHLGRCFEDFVKVATKIGSGTEARRNTEKLFKRVIRKGSCPNWQASVGKSSIAELDNRINTEMRDRGLA